MQQIQNEFDNLQDFLKTEFFDSNKLEIYIKRQLNQSENYLLSKKENVYLLFPSLQYEVVRLISSKSKAYDDYKTNDTLTNQIVQSFKTLKLNQNENPNEILSQLISKLANHIQIQELMILGEFQNITARGFLDLSSDLQKLDNISKVNIELRRNIIKEQGASEIGSGLAKFPNLTNLILRLNQNVIGDQGAQNLGCELGNCLKLTTLELHLHICRIHTQGARDLCIGLSKCQNLKTLMLLLSNNLIGDEDIKQGIGSGIGKLITIQTLELYLQKNHLYKNDVLSLGQGLNQCTQLSSLKLYLDIICNKSISKLSNQISKCLNLSSLELNFDQFNLFSSKLERFDKKDQLCSGLGKFSSKSVLILNISLEGNNISAIGASTIFNGLCKCINLQKLVLNLSDNSICEGGILDLGSGLSQLTYLKYLTLLLKYNSICKQTIAAIGSGLAQCTKLSTLQLNLDNNKIDSEAISILTSSIDNYIYLSALILSLNSNEIRSTGLQSLADWLVKQNNISYLNLSLSGNKIDDKGSQYLSSTFSKYPKMSVLILQLRSNNIDFTLYTKTKFAILKILRLVHFQFFMDQQEYDNEEEGGG